MWELEWYALIAVKSICDVTLQIVQVEEAQNANIRITSLNTACEKGSYGKIKSSQHIQTKAWLMDKLCAQQYLANTLSIKRTNMHTSHYQWILSCHFSSLYQQARRRIWKTRTCTIETWTKNKFILPIAMDPWAMANRLSTTISDCRYNVIQAA